MTNTQHMSQGEILLAARLIEAQRNNKTVTWAVWAPGENPLDADVSTLLTGLPRYIEKANHATGEYTDSDDIRDQFLRITAGFEHWLKVSDVLAAMDAGLFVID